MVSIAGSKKLKRQMAPLFWGISRKDKRFVVTVKPGGHKKNISIPTAIFVRDTLKLVNTLREAKSVIYGGKIKVDGTVRKSIHHGLGLMDVVEMKEGTFVLPKRALVDIGQRQIEIPTDLIMAVGMDKPVIQIQ